MCCVNMISYTVFQAVIYLRTMNTDNPCIHFYFMYVYQNTLLITKQYILMFYIVLVNRYLDSYIISYVALYRCTYSHILFLHRTVHVQTVFLFGVCGFGFFQAITLHTSEV